MKMYRPVNLEEEVVSIHLSHGVAPRDASYAYFVLPATTTEKTRTFDPAASVRIHRNDGSAQIVEVLGEDPAMWIATYDTEPIQIEGVTFTPSAPGIFKVTRNGEGFEITESSIFLPEY